MRIVCTVTNDLLQDQRMDRICRSLAAAGHDVTLIGREKPSSPPLPRDRPYRMLRLPMRFSAGKLFYLEYNYRLWRWLRRGRWDAVNSVDLDSLPGGFLGKRRGTHWIFDAHEYFSETPEVVHRPLVRGIWRTLGRRLVPRTRLRYTVGSRLAEALGKEYGVPFGVVRNLPRRRPVTESEIVSPPYASEFPSRESDAKYSTSGKKIILYQGMLNAGRGLETAVAALRHLPEVYELWLVGNGDLFTLLQSSNLDLLAAGRLKMPGFVAPGELPDYTRRAWLGLNLLDPVSPSYYYSLANKALDYVQDGLPSVQMNFPEYRALQEQYGCFFLLDALDPDRLATLIQSIGKDAELYRTVAENCRAAAADLCWEKEEEELLRVWARL